jgi:hypothetical protein
MTATAVHERSGCDALADVRIPGAGRTLLRR